MKIAVLGYSGSGKSTLAKFLGVRYDAPVLYLDAVQFTANWAERDSDEAINIVVEFMKSNERWVIDGNYAKFFQSERLLQADRIIYMDFSRWSCLLRVFRRYLHYKNQTREIIAAGCIEKIDLEFIWWVLHEGRTAQVRRHYDNIIALYPEKTATLKNQKQLNAYMALPFE